MKPATLRCTACGRALTVVFVSIPTKAGPLNYGPKCGRALKVADGIYRAPTVTRERIPVATSRRKKLVPGDPRTVDWIEEMAAA